jgi:hypothetical protein
MQHDVLPPVSLQYGAHRQTRVATSDDDDIMVFWHTRLPMSPEDPPSLYVYPQSGNAAEVVPASSRPVLAQKPWPGGYKLTKNAGSARARHRFRDRGAAGGDLASTRPTVARPRGRDTRRE